MCFSTGVEETHWVYTVGWWIYGILSWDPGVGRMDGRGRDVSTVSAHRRREKEFSLSALKGPLLL